VELRKALNCQSCDTYLPSLFYRELSEFPTIPMFTGKLTLKVCEAIDLKPTDFQTRHNVKPGAEQTASLDPYVSIDVDEQYVNRSTSKSKTLSPVWNESFETDCVNAQNVGLTIFHDAAIPPDVFVANCMIPFEDVADKKADIWVMLEPQGKIHVVVSLTKTKGH